MRRRTCRKCTRDGHADRPVVKDGSYGSPPPPAVPLHRDGGQQKTGEVRRFHWFTPPLPRLMSPAGVCDVCDSALRAHTGPASSRTYAFPVREVAAAFVAVGTGASYARAADRARVAVGRPQLGGEQGGALVAEWLDLLAPVVLDAHAEQAWPETLVLDNTWFMVENRRTHRRRSPSMSSGPMATRRARGAAGCGRCTPATRRGRPTGRRCCARSMSATRRSWSSPTATPPSAMPSAPSGRAARPVPAGAILCPLRAPPARQRGGGDGGRRHRWLGALAAPPPGHRVPPPRSLGGAAREGRRVRQHAGVAGRHRGRGHPGRHPAPAAGAPLHRRAGHRAGHRTGLPGLAQLRATQQAPHQPRPRPDPAAPQRRRSATPLPHPAAPAPRRDRRRPTASSAPARTPAPGHAPPRHRTVASLRR